MRRQLKIAALVFWLAAAASISGVSMVPLSISELTAKSGLIVFGTVVSKSCQRDREGRIYTKVELNVKEVWKGSPSANPLTIVYGGGIVGSERVVVAGQVEYQTGEDVVAFLVLNPRGEAVTLGLSQGKFQVWKERANGPQLVRNPFHGGSGSGASLASPPSAQVGRLTLAELRDRVKGSLKGNLK